MFKIPQIEKSTYYVDKAMESMQEYATKERDKIGDRFERSKGTAKKEQSNVNFDKRKDLELQKIRFLNDRLNESIRKINRRFPDFRKMDEIYKKLINTGQSKVPHIQDALARLLWIANTVDDFTQKTEHKLKTVKSQETAGFLMKKYFGRVNSLFRKNKEYFQILEDARKFMNKLPTFEDLYTVSIAGFPNVGKSTLMKAISGSNVEIQNYPFTTKGLMFSYLNYNGKKAIQLIDTPGLLGRDKNNDIEERAQIVINEYCQYIVFVIDFTEGCGYDIKNQLKLLKKIKQDTSKPIILYLSKTDIYNEEDVERKEESTQLIKKYIVFEDKEKLKKFLLEEFSKQIKTFDPAKLKIIN